MSENIEAPLKSNQHKAFSEGGNPLSTDNKQRTGQNISQK
jgi:hypothetical protein